MTSAHLAATCPAYMIIDHADHVLRLYQHLKLANTHPIAVGCRGWETRYGLYDVQGKQTNASW